MFTLETAYHWLLSLQTFGIKLGLVNMRALARQLGNPHKAVPCVHVAGTNGKGSTCAFLERILRESGLRTGFYSSPHLVAVNERFRIDGEPVSDEALARAAWEVHEAEEVWNRENMDQEAIRLTFFEATTLMAFRLFQEAKVDMVIYEVGMGGRLDATNIVTPKVSVITTLSLEHQQYLGDTLAAIAGEKAGIIKKDVPVIVARQKDEAFAVVARKAKERHAPLWTVGQELSVTGAKTLTVRQGDRSLTRLSLGLSGEHQRENAALAVGAAWRLRDAGFDIPDKAIRKGLAETRWPGRLERFGSSPTMLLDAAHNDGGVETLVRYLEAVRPTVARIVLVFGVMQDKDYPPMTARLASVADAWVATTVSNMPRALDAAVLAKHLAPYGKVCSRKDVGAAMREARNLAGPDGLVVVCGSIFLLGLALPLAKQYAETCADRR